MNANGETHLPVDDLNANLRRLGRSLDADALKRQGWNGDEYGLYMTWSDGFSAFVGFGPVATAMVEGWGEGLH
jgi:hypothetical protein